MSKLGHLCRKVSESARNAIIGESLRAKCLRITHVLPVLPFFLSVHILNHYSPSLSVHHTEVPTRRGGGHPLTSKSVDGLERLHVDGIAYAATIVYRIHVQPK